MLEEANRFWKTASISQDDNNISDEDVDTTIQMLQAGTILGNVYATSVIPEIELFSEEMQTAVGNNYGKLQLFDFNYFQNIMKNKLDNNK